MFTFTPLLGAQSDSHASQSILEFDGGVKVLVDVGWTEDFAPDQLVELEKHVSSLSFILLTHATISHLGAFAHCSKHIPNFTQIPVYATSPVIAFGRTLLQDLYSSAPLAATFIHQTSSSDGRASGAKVEQSHILKQLPSLEEITKYFSVITPLKYSQPYQPTASQFSAPLEGLTLTAYNSGHTLGGTIWHIQHGMESVVYAVGWNQARENVIAGAAWFGGVGGSEVLEQLRRPTALICSSIGGDRVALSGSRKARDERLLGHIRGCLAKGGTVLIPTDSSARILELAWVLEKAWQDGADDPVLKAAKVFMASKSANATLRHARSLLEWMDDGIVREFEADDETATKSHVRTNSKQSNGIVKPSRPFEFRHIKVIERTAQLERVWKTDGPRVILASDLSLDWGYSVEALEHIANRENNIILLTEQPALKQDNLRPCQVLWQWYEERRDGVAVEQSAQGTQIEQVHCHGRKLTLDTTSRAPLDEAEAQQYQQYMATQRQIQASLVMNSDRVMEAADDNVDDESSSSSSDESNDEQQGRALNASAAIGHGSRNKITLSDEDMGAGILLRKRGVYDFDVRNKKGRNAVFPYTHSRKRGDDFGELIKPEEFLREEEKEEQDGHNASKPGNTLGEKRKWDEAEKKTADHPHKRQQNTQSEMAGAFASGAIGVSGDESDESEVEEDVEKNDIQGPAKLLFAKKKLVVNARIAFVDFSGLHDQRSLQLMIPLIGPKKLIFTGGSSKETLTLAADCKELLGIKIAGVENETVTEIFTPSDGQIIDASVDTNAWIVKLSRSLAKKLHWQRVKNIGVVTLQAQLKAESQKIRDAENQKTKRLKLEDDTAPQDQDRIETVEPVLDTIPTILAASTRSVNQPIHVGDMRLADLRRIMNTDGHVAEFRGEGTLLVDGLIAVKKLSTGKIIVEGVPVSSMAAMTARGSDSFTQVKRKIYEGLAVVAAG